MKITTMAVSAIGLVGAFGLGVFLGPRLWVGRQSGANGSQTIVTGDVDLLRAENQRLKAQLASQVTSGRADGSSLSDESTRVATSLGALKLLTDLQRKKLIRPGTQIVTFINQDGKLNEAFTELFALTPAESATLQAAIERARSRLAALERANATVSENKEGDRVVTVKQFAAEGGQAYDALMKTFADTLGAERQAAFLTFGATQVEKALSGFGAIERTVTFSRKTLSPGRGTGPETQYRVSEKSKMGEGSFSSSTASYRDRDDLLARVGTIGQFLPPDY